MLPATFRIHMPSHSFGLIVAALTQLIAGNLSFLDGIIGWVLCNRSERAPIYSAMHSSWS